MATETEIPQKSSWHRLLVYWQTKNHPKRLYDIALIIAVAVYTNRKIYKEELETARKLIKESYDEDEDAIEEIMHYIEMRLSEFAHDERSWDDAAKQVKTLIKNDENLYRYCIDIFESDEHLDREERQFERSLRRLLLAP